MSRGRRALLAVVVLALLAGVGAFTLLPSWLGGAVPVRDDVYDGIVKRGTLRVGMDASFPPFEFIGDQQTLQGFDVELSRELAARMNLRVDFVTVGFDTLYPELAAQQFDVIISALPYDRTRTRDVAYSDIYFRGGEVLVLRAGAPKAEVLADLKGQAVGVELGSSAETIARQSERRYGYRVQSYESLDVAANALGTGDVQALVADAVSARLLRRTHPGITIAEQAVGAEPNYVVAMPIDAPELLAVLNRQLRAMDKDGALKTLLDKWF